MRIYSSETIGKILRDMKSGERSSIFTELRQQEAFQECWKQIPNVRLQRVTPSFSFSKVDETVTLHCSSSVMLNLFRRDRATIEQYLRPAMEEYGLTKLVFTLAER
jgi:hypothetical protein